MNEKHFLAEKFEKIFIILSNNKKSLIELFFQKLKKINFLQKFAIIIKEKVNFLLKLRNSFFSLKRKII